MKRYTFLRAAIILILLSFIIGRGLFAANDSQEHNSLKSPSERYWFILHRKSNKEEFFFGIPGDESRSEKLKTFIVKSGILGERPTPLPQLLGRKYWLLVDEFETRDNPETAPYFLTLDIPAPTGEPYGPSPYTECDGKQCNWILPGAFGLHGVAGDPTRLSPENLGSSGCIRHTDEDITYLYNLLDPKNEKIQYYVEDN